MVHDVIGVGFGPANLALAIAMEESGAELDAVFLEARPEPGWQTGMLLGGADIQNHPCRDLVSLRNPRSRYSFVNYLHEHGRLMEFLNLPAPFPLRKEYARYIAWAARQVDAVTHYGARAVEISAGTSGGEHVYHVRLEDGRRFTGRCLVLGPGRTPYWPAPFEQLQSPRVVHLTQYLPRLAQLSGPPRKVAVIGGSQSAVELTLDLARRFPRAEVSTYVRSFSLRSKDHSPFSEEGYFPGFTEYFARVGRAGKRKLNSDLRPTNYSASDQDVLDELYRMIYEQRLDGDQHVFVRGNREVRAAEDDGERVKLWVHEVHTGEVEQAWADLVVLATGFRDLGPGPEQESWPELLQPLGSRFAVDGDGYPVIGLDYALSAESEEIPPVFLNGLCESTHGIGDAGSFSLLSLRAAEILAGIHRRLAARRAA